MNKLLGSIELYKGIHFYFDNTKKDIWYDIYNFMNTYNLIETDEKPKNYYGADIINMHKKVKVKTSNREKIKISLSDDKNWHNGFSVSGKYNIKVQPSLSILLLEINEADLDNVTLHFIKGKEESIKLKDLYLVSKMSGIKPDPYTCDIGTFDELSVTFDTLQSAIRFRIRYTNIDNEAWLTKYVMGTLEDIKDRLDAMGYKIDALNTKLSN